MVKFRSLLCIGAAILAVIGLFGSCENFWMKNLLNVKDEGGDGTAGNPFWVYNEVTLWHVGNPDSGSYSEWTLNAHYIQTQDIFLTGPFQAIGDNSAKFTGSFNGNGKTISNLNISSMNDNQGLFGYIDSSAVIKNVRLESCSISGKSNTGSIVGANYGQVQNCSASGSVSSTSLSTCTGGVVGNNYNQVQNCHSTCTVSGVTYAGGVVGYNNTGGIVDNCYATGPVTGTSYVGGLAGNSTNFSTLKNSYSTGSVSGNDYTGGVAGNSEGTVQNCYATGSVHGANQVGGVVGNNIGIVQNCYATSHVEGSANIGGIAGNSLGTIQNCYATGSVTSIGNRIGGIVGNITGGTVQNCYATGPVSGTGNDFGGIVGYIQSGSVQNCVALNTSITGGSNLNRVAGTNSGTLNNNYAREDMMISGLPVTNLSSSSLNGADLIIGFSDPTNENATVFAVSDGWSDTVWTIPGGHLTIMLTETALPTLKHMPGIAQNPQLLL